MSAGPAASALFSNIGNQTAGFFSGTIEPVRDKKRINIKKYPKKKYR